MRITWISPTMRRAICCSIADKMLAAQNYQFGRGAREAFSQYLALRSQQPHFANARSVRNALDRARLRQASRLFADRNREFTPEDLSTLSESDIRASRVFQLVAHPQPARSGSKE